MTHYLDRIDPGFEERFRRSEPARYLVADWLESLGGTECVIVPPGKCREKVEDWQKHTDQGDLLICLWDGRGLVGEVKKRRFRFTGIADYPYDTLICDHPHKAPSDIYFTLDADMKCCLSARRWETGRQWKTVRMFMPKAGNRYKRTLLIPKSCLRQHDLRAFHHNP